MTSQTKTEDRDKTYQRAREYFFLPEQEMECITTVSVKLLGSNQDLVKWHVFPCYSFLGKQTTLL